MARCKNTRNLEIHHVRRDGSNGIQNAEVLCHDCHIQTDSYAEPGISPPDFTEAVKTQALLRAEHQCQCNRSGCGFH
jgi:hypothetical protein